MDKVLTYSSLGILVVVGFGFGLSLRSRSSERSAPSRDANSAAFSESTAPITPSSSVRTAKPLTVAERPVTAAPIGTSTTPQKPNSDAALIAELRALQGAAPLVALRLAREGNERFPNSPEAPERTWHIVKSLTDLGQFEEAREEAQRMMEQYPPSHWTADIKRHVLSHPPTPPQPQQPAEP